MSQNDQKPPASSIWISEGGEDIEFSLTTPDATLILDQIVVHISQETLDAIRQHRTLTEETFETEIQAYLDNASICFIIDKLPGKRDSLINDPLIQANFPQDLIKEYVDEAEHQNGLEYWTAFDTPQELYEDLRLYQDNR